PKICGDGIGPLSLECLREVGFDLEKFSPYPRCRFVTLVSPGGGKWRPAYEKAAEDPDGLEYGHVIPRMVFDKEALDHAVACGAKFEAGWSFAGLTREREWVTSVTLERNGEKITVRPKFLLAADGEHSQIRKTLTGKQRPADWLALRGYVEGVRGLSTDMEFHFTPYLKPGYAWVFPEGGERKANVGVYVHQKTLAKGPSIRQLYDQFLKDFSAAGRPLEGASPCGPAQGYPICPYHPGRRLHFGNCLLLGDAAGLADPLTGEGIFPALYSGLAAAEAVRQCLARGEKGDLSAYPGLLARMFLPLRRRGIFLLGLLGHLPSLVDWIFSRAATDEVLSSGIFAVVSGNESLARLFSAPLWARIYFPAFFRPKALPPGN
ncbi:MAG: FAD-dependent monooxygenase, partial [Bdellovibrionota bacterium]